MSARDELFRRVSGAFVDEDRANALIDAFRAEVLREAADALEARVADEDVDTRTTWAGMDAAYLRHLASSSGPAAGDKQPLRGRALLDAKAAADAEATHWQRLGITPAAGDKQPETSPWQRAVDGLNALVQSGIPFHIEPDGHISNPFGDEHIEWDRAAERWQLTFDDEEGQR